MNKSKIAAVLLVVYIAFVPLANAKDELTEKKRELESIYNQIEVQRKKLMSTKIKEKNVLLEISSISTKIKDSSDKLSYAQMMTQKRTQELRTISGDLLESEYNMGVMTKKFQGRLTEIYKTQDVDWLELVLSTNNLMDMINEFYYFEKLVKRDIILIDEIKQEKKKIELNKKKAEVKKRDIETQAKVIKQEKNSLEKNKVDKEKLKQMLSLKREEYEREIDELEKNSKQIESLIRRLAAKPAKHQVVSTGTFMWPVDGWISSSFGYRVHPIFKTVKFHTGIDIVSPMGRPIKATDSGIIIFAGKWGGYGKVVIIDHGKGFSSLYGHQSRIMVSEGQRVEKGQIIGLVGSTGFSTGPHLHFEVRVNGSPDNPLKYLPQK